MSKKNPQPGKYYLLTLGCPKNTVDSEGMAMLLSQGGFRGTASAAEADVIIVNTCGFLASAEDESVECLSELARGKRKGQLLIAAGCMAQRAGERILREVPGVDGLLGTRRWMEIVPFVQSCRAGQGELRLGGQVRPGRPIRPARPILLDDPIVPLPLVYPRPPATSGSAYLKISDGCNATCAFCSIPVFKGRLQSRPAEAIEAEARQLVAAGAHELILIAQDTTSYSRDLGQVDALPDLIRGILAAAPELRWLRLMYAYPGHISARLIEVMAGDPRICHYLDIPLQHGHPATLRRMHRPSDVAEQMDTIGALRAAMPDIALRSTFIVGFPGETEEEYQGLLDLLAAAQFDKVGVFAFSAEPGTRAATMPDQVPSAIAAARLERAMAAQQRISLERNAAQVGRILDVLVERVGRFPEYDGLVSMARCYRDAPEVDGQVVVTGRLAVGQMARVRITGALEYDLLGEVVRP